MALRQVEQRLGVAQGDEGAGRPAGSHGRLRPGQRGTERLCGIGSGERTRRIGGSRRAATYLVDGAGKRELRGALALEHVGAPTAACVLERTQHAIGRRESRGRLACHDPEPVEQ